MRWQERIIAEGADLTREEWEELWAAVDVKARSEKLSHAATLEISQHYLSIPTERRPAVDELLGEWVLSDDERKRFDALALIREHRISSALPALEALRVKLSQSAEPGAPYEGTKVESILADLGEGRGCG